jgi:hypothetical protein
MKTIHSQFPHLSFRDNVVLVETGSDKTLEMNEVVKNMDEELVMLLREGEESYTSEELRL